MSETFKIGGVVFTSTWLVADGRYVWTANAGKLRAGVNVGARTYWAEANGKFLGDSFVSLKAAMHRLVMSMSEDLRGRA
jgi:hypothetical protein